MTDVTLIAAIVGPVATIGGGIIGFVYRLGQRLGRMEETTKQIPEINSQLGDVRERLAHLEGHVGVDPEKENE